MASGSGKKQINRGVSICKSSPPSEPLFKYEIAQKMRSYGDSQTPYLESVILMEKIIVEQMRWLLSDLMDSAIRRTGEPHPSQIDVEFVMRKNPIKIQRMRDYLKCLDQRQRMINLMNGRPANDDADEDTIYDDVGQICVKRDEEKMRRLYRADRISFTMNKTLYKRYIQSKQITFHSKKASAMRNKIHKLLSPPLDVVLSERMYAIFAYLMSETIATVVDNAILTRIDSYNRDVDPSNGTSLPRAPNKSQLCPEVTQGRALDGVKPITVLEIHEAIRRHSAQYVRKIGFRGDFTGKQSKPYLAL